MIALIIGWAIAVMVLIFLIQLVGILALGIVVIALLETGHTYWAIALGVVLVVIKAVDIYDDL